jgi:hypothetical protein
MTLTLTAPPDSIDKDADEEGVLDFDKIFKAHIDANQKTWKHDRMKSVGASEVFDCIRKIWFVKLGALNGFAQDEEDPDDPDSWGARERGNIIEEYYVVPAVRDNLPGAAKLRMAGKQQETLMFGENTATPDGLIVGLPRNALKKYGIADIGSDCIMLEIKSIDPRVALHKEKDIHHGQTQTQMGIIRETTKYRPNFAVILYIDASFIDNLNVFVVPYDEVMWKIAQDRATTVFETTDPTQLAPEGKIDHECTYCKWQGACAKVTIGGMPPDLHKKATQDMIEALEPLVLAHRELEDAAKAAEHDLEVSKAEIKQALADMNTRKLRKLGEKKKTVWSATWYAVAGKKTFSQKRLVEATGIDLEPYKVPGNDYEVLRISFGGKDDKVVEGEDAATVENAEPQELDPPEGL